MKVTWSVLTVAAFLYAGAAARADSDGRHWLESGAHYWRTIDEVAGFKRESIQLLGNQGASDRLSRDETHAENALLRADIEKKSAELTAMELNRQRIENDVENLRRELAKLQQRGIFRR